MSHPRIFNILGIQPEFDRIRVERLFDVARGVAVECCRDRRHISGYAVHGADIGQKNSKRSKNRFAETLEGQTID